MLKYISEGNILTENSLYSKYNLSFCILCFCFVNESLHQKVIRGQWLDKQHHDLNIFTRINKAPEQTSLVLLDASATFPLQYFSKRSEGAEVWRCL